MAVLLARFREPHPGSSPEPPYRPSPRGWWRGLDGPRARDGCVLVPFNGKSLGELTCHDSRRAPFLAAGSVKYSTRQPLSITFSTDEQAREFGITEEERSKIQRIGKTLKAYLQASRDLVVGRYAELRDYVPEHMTQACTPTVVVLNDGIIVRYDLVGNPELKVRAGLLRGSISEYVPQLSESVVYCPRDASDFDVSDKGLTFHLQKLSTQGDVTPIASTRIAMVAPIGSTQLQAQPGTRPIPIASVTSELEMLLECETAPEHGRRE